MKVDRRTFVLAALAAACGCRRSGAAAGEAERAARYLWAQQAADGGFHSATYGLLSSGQALTPFVLGALLEVPESTLRPPEGAVDRGLEFIRRHTNAEGMLGLAGEGSADYPNYATALAVDVLVKASRDGWEADIRPMAAALGRQQFSEANGWQEGDAPYGGWGMGGAILRPPDAGHVDLSMTRCVLEALRSAGVSGADPALGRALVYLARSQNPDGGFVFSLVNPETNKAGEEAGESGSGFSGYGTATADGLLALRAAGVAEDDDRILRAVRWLGEHHLPDRVPGFDAAPYEAWTTGLRFYYAGVISKAMPGLGVRLPPPESDGSYRNTNDLVKEDDPLIATPFALGVLRNREAQRG